MNVKNKLRKPNLKIVATTIFILGLALGGIFGYRVATSAYIGDVTEVWVNPPFHEASYVIGQYNSTFYYAKNGTTGNYDYFGSNATTVTQATIESISIGLILLKGTLAFTGSRLWMRSNVHLTGMGVDLTTLNLADGFEIGSESTDSVENVTISYLTVNTGTTSAAFSFGGNAGTLRNHISLQHVKVINNQEYPSGGNAGLIIFWAGPSDGDVDDEILDQYNSMLDVTFLTNVPITSDAISISFQRWFRMEACHVEARVAIFKCKSSAFVGNTVIIRYGYTNTGFYITGKAINIAITGNVLEEVGGETGSCGIKANIDVAETVESITISGNTIKGFYNGVEFVGNVSHSSITGNTFYNTSEAAITIASTGSYYPHHNIISSNVIYDPNGHGYAGIGAIILSHAQYTIVTCNNIDNQHSSVINYGVWLLNCQHTVVSDLVAHNLDSWYILEEGTTDYSTIIGCDTYDAYGGTYGIKLVGANSHASMCWNGTSWIA